MDKQIQNLKKKTVSKQLLGSILKNKTKSQVICFIGHSNYHSEFDVWAYELIKNVFFRREMILFFNDEQVYDIQITDYFLGNKVRELIY